MRPLIFALSLFIACGSLLAADVPETPNLRLTNETRVYQQTRDAVVNIASTRIVNAAVGWGGMGGDEIFDRLLGPQIIRQVPMESLGSGFVIHPAGYIVTNEHVIDRASEVQVIFANGQKLPAQVLATDNAHDLAVLKVVPAKDKPLSAVALGASDDLLIGEPVYAIGNPYGYAGSMTRGIVSAVNRDLDFGQGKVYKDLIQTDASINPGNSGGPLLNAYGQVIGVNTAIRADAHGIGFAIGASQLRDLLPAFLNTEVLHRAVLGFAIEEKRTLTPPSTVTAAVLVKSVAANSQAAKAGLQRGDQIVAIQSSPVHTIVDALVAVAGVEVGDRVSLRILRAGKTHDIQVPVVAAPPPESERIARERLGITGKTITPALAREQKLPVATGILVTEVEQDGPAAKAGMESGDILYQLGPYYVTSLEDAATLLKTAQHDLQVRVGLIRSNTRGRTVVQLR